MYRITFHVDVATKVITFLSFSLSSLREMLDSTSGVGAAKFTTNQLRVELREGEHSFVWEQHMQSFLGWTLRNLVLFDCRSVGQSSDCV